MKKSFKYLLLILMVSFLIATLCCHGHQIFERYAPYPNQLAEVPNDFTIDLMQDYLEKYNNIVSEPQKAGSIDYDIKELVEDIKEKEIQRKKNIYQRLSNNDTYSGGYMPYEVILPNEFQEIRKRIPPKIKGEKVVLQPEINITSSVSLDIKDIKERSIEGEVFYEKNNCKGYWSDWNTDNCGVENNRCGLQFRKYEIISPEKNDENGPGKKCPYNDGDIKYRYCSGSSADDYESNMERCNIPVNICPCKLNMETEMNLNGEKVYDLENEDCDYQRRMDCICPFGFTREITGDICKLTPGIDCSIKEPGCIYDSTTSPNGEKCRIPEFLTEQDKNNFYERYTTINGKCKEKDCPCPNGKKVEKEKCIVDGLKMCDITELCDEGYYFQGNPPTCEKRTDGKECNCFFGTSGTGCDDPTTHKCESCGTDTGYTKETTIGNCRAIYENINDLISPESCCTPDFLTCKIEQNDLDEKNIELKLLSNEMNQYLSLSISELLEEYNGKENVSMPLTAESIIEESDPKQFLIRKLMDLDSDDDESNDVCLGYIRINSCGGSYQCKPGYAFLPDNNYSHENELRIVSCEETGEEQEICMPQTDNCENELNENEEGCYYPSYREDIQGDSGGTGDPKKCDVPEAGQSPNSKCNVDVEGSGDQPCQAQLYKTPSPKWNGICVPVSCTVSDEVKEIYNISYDTCSSTSRNCNLANVTCKEEQYNVPNTERMIYCRTPSKVNSSYLDNDYELVTFGCSKNPPPLSEAEDARRQRFSENEGSIIESDAESQAASAVADAGIDTARIGERASATGSTSQQAQELDTGMLRAELEAEEQASERTDGSDTRARAIASGIDSAVLDSMETR